jgi:hypothetical protein
MINTNNFTDFSLKKTPVYILYNCGMFPAQSILLLGTDFSELSIYIFAISGGDFLLLFSITFKYVT